MLAVHKTAADALASLSIHDQMHTIQFMAALHSYL